jgi:hypothetical protein
MNMNDGRANVDGVSALILVVAVMAALFWAALGYAVWWMVN